MANNTFNYNSARAKKARLSKALCQPAMVFLLVITSILLTTLGVLVLIFAKNQLGWIVVIPVPMLMMIYFWQKYELTSVPKGTTDDINDILSARTLAALKPTGPHRSLTIEDLITTTNNTRSGIFMSNRFGLNQATMEEIVKHLPNVTPEQVFETAREIRVKTESEVISGGIITIALFEQIPDFEDLLRQIKLEPDDLYQGIIWYNYLHGIVKDAKKPQNVGGIARDFAFGYIPTLQRFGTNISDIRLHAMKTQIPQMSHKEILDQMIQVFSGGGRQNVALIGPAGSGRQTMVNAFAETIMNGDNKLPDSLKYRQVFMLDSASLISAAPNRGQIESLVVRILNEAYNAKNIIVFLNNAELFFKEGTGSVDISSVLLPVLQAGSLRMILTMDQQQFLQISAKMPALSNNLNKIMVPPANQEETMKIMQNQVPHLEAQHRVTYTYQALCEAYRLSERYVHDLEMPGRAINLLETSANYSEHGLVTAAAVAQTIEKTQGVKVQVAESQDDRDKLLNLEQLIHERMIDQVEAVKTVSNALRRSAAGVRNESRPIGTFMFLGPTGVGKTELAKALSDVYFNGESQMVRIDLNEYNTAEDVARLISDGADNPDSLTAQVMKQPFSVVLLDEVEKAHPQVLTTLLQMLDEGILRDTKNREISFRDTIVIMTSNAGADLIRESIQAGIDITKVKEELMNKLITDGDFRPEFLNRFDEVCIFSPLGKEELVQIVDLMIKSVNKTLSLQKIKVVLTDEAKLLLVDRGYDPQMGARPMRRIVQNTVQNLVASCILSGTAKPGSDLTITADQITAELEK